MNRPPHNVSEALRDGGLPQHFTFDQLQWLEAKHRDLSSRVPPGPKGQEHAHWRLRWAFTAHDLMATLISRRLL